MCGIFGIITSKENKYTEAFLTKAIKQLAYLSLTRGKDSSGLCTLNQVSKEIDVIKGPMPIKQLFRESIISKSVKEAFINSGNNTAYAFGHARLVTNGTQLNDANNQPVVKDGIVGVHNGIIVNVEELWTKHPDITRENEIDTEVMLSLIRAELNKNKHVEEAVSKSINKVFGTVSTALVFDDFDKFVLATNNGSLYILHNNKDILFFASERFMLTEFVKKVNISQIEDYHIEQILPNNGVSINLQNFSINGFSLKEDDFSTTENTNKDKSPIHIINIESAKKQLSTVMDLNVIHINPQAAREQSILQYPLEKIKALRRCTKCVLPETFPFIHFDDIGECNYCNSYKKKKLLPIEELVSMVRPFRSDVGSRYVLLPYSGGRDSSYVLHYAKKELNLNVKTYTYDWGMVTDLARRNVARVCGKLGVENIIIAADIHAKRRNVRLNIDAWLKKPELGMVPLFMAGDKYFLYYANEVSIQNNIELNIWGSNYLENTEFKTGFCGIKPNFHKKRIDSLTHFDKVNLGLFFGKNYLLNPAYLNNSLIDTAGSFFSRYLLKRKGFVQLFDYIVWDEKKVEETIIGKYEWEKSIDTISTWRIGDGTASFYNYIYTLIVGFSENDTFRSNQVREGMISRERALELVCKDNIPRYNSLKWYLEIVGLDFEDTIKKINKMQKLY